MDDPGLRLGAIDGTNPLGWMAALGAMVALATTREADVSEPRLRWEYRGCWTPILYGADEEQVVERCLQDLRRTSGNPAFLELHYQKDGKGALQRDLKPPPEFYRQYLESLARASDRAGLALAAGFATDVAVDKSKGNTKPTALHFTCGQQQFLTIADQLAEQLQEADLHEALFEGWHYERERKTFMWDASTYRDYALRADKPSNAKKGTVPGADWLAFRALQALPCAPNGTAILTTLCRGSGNNIRMHWPIWEPSLTLHEIRSLLSLGSLMSLTQLDREARGIIAVFDAAVVRSDQGLGGFAPPSPVLPSTL